MVDSRAKGARGEYLVRDMLRVATGLQFERVPNSGALEYLKGDLYVPNEKNRFCIEVKNYSEIATSNVRSALSLSERSSETVDEAMKRIIEQGSVVRQMVNKSRELEIVIKRMEEVS